jgi:DNA-binding NarL/FixJ family response regulator
MTGMSGSVLVVDDDPGFRGTAKRLLTASGVSVVGEAASVASAMAATHHLRPGGLLVDIGLPEGDGVALAVELSGLPWRPLVVLTSSDPDAVTPETVQLCGAKAFIAKEDLPDAPLKRLLTES